MTKDVCDDVLCVFQFVCFLCRKKTKKETPNSKFVDLIIVFVVDQRFFLFFFCFFETVISQG